MTLRNGVAICMEGTGTYIGLRNVDSVETAANEALDLAEKTSSALWGAWAGVPTSRLGAERAR